MKNSKENGITLIALIITIIVLLILAGVSITMVVGDSGILSQATNSSVKTDIADTKEQIEVELTNYWDEEGNYQLVDVVNAAYEITGNEVDIENETVLSAKGNTVDISDLIAGVYKITANKINNDSENYIGRTVEYTYTSGTEAGNNIADTEWQVFYADDENIYLIASNIVSMDYLPSELSSVSYNGYSSIYFSAINSYDVSSDFWNTEVVTKWLSLAKDAQLSTSNTNMRMTAFLLDTDIWSSFTDGKYAKYAIGGPTIELFVASYNSYYSGQSQIYCNNLNDYGYYVGTSSKPTTNYYKLTCDGIYCLAKSSSKSTTGIYDSSSFLNYLIASPDISNYATYCVGTTCYDLNNYKITNSVVNTSSSSFSGIRPVVCLQSGVTLIENVDGTLKLSL